MSPGIGLMDRRLKTEKDAISLATSGILKEYKTELEKIETLETKYDDDAGDWYVALGWEEKRAIVKMDSVLANEHEQGFMVNQAIIDFWKSCNGQRKVTELVDMFAQQTGLQRTQVEKEVMQLLKQLHEGGLLVIPNQNDAPNVEFKKSN